MKKGFKFLSLLLVICLAASFSGCGNQPSVGNTGGTSSANSEAAGEKTTNPADATKKTKLTVWGGVPAENGPQKLVEAFMAENPDIEVEFCRYVNDDQGNVKLDTSLMAGTDIDVYFTYFQDLIPKRVEGGVAEDLTTWLEKDNFDLKESFGEGFFTYKDKVYSIPTATDRQIIYINKDMFDAKGIPIPAEWTIDEYREITKMLTHDEGGIKVYGGCFDWDNICKNIMHVPLLGKDTFYKDDGTSNFDHPIFKTSIELLSDLMLNDQSHISVIEYQTSKLSPYGEFLNQKSATAAAGLWIARYISDTEKYPHDFVTAAAPFPLAQEGSQNYQWPGLGNNIMMNKNSNNKEAAYKLMKYWATEGSIYMCKGGKLPAWKGIDKEEVLVEILGENADKLYDVESFERVIFNEHEKSFVNIQTAAFSQVIKVYKEEVEKVLVGQQDTSTALINAKKRADEHIKEASK